MESDQWDHQRQQQQMIIESSIERYQMIIEEGKGKLKKKVNIKKS